MYRCLRSSSPSSKSPKEMRSPQNSSKRIKLQRSSLGRSDLGEPGTTNAEIDTSSRCRACDALSTQCFCRSRSRIYAPEDRSNDIEPRIIHNMASVSDYPPPPAFSSRQRRHGEAHVSWSPLLQEANEREQVLTSAIPVVVPSTANYHSR